jgi:hypothetical protein
MLSMAILSFLPLTMRLKSNEKRSKSDYSRSLSVHTHHLLTDDSASTALLDHLSGSILV